ncbi:hypothetical protein SUDANB15_02527 [Streptomyces sp. enrichment culture]|uniref:hypothetical protein n=1 Tax=Streptomyces sp. enrichment culture TaxID=1795815 RepID=UPI003F553831
MMIGVGELWNAITSDFGTGLLGALVGGGFTLAGTWLQSRSSEKAAELAHSRATAQRALEIVSTFAVTVQRQTYQEHGTHEDREKWNREVMAQETAITAVLSLLPDDQKETRNECLDLLGGVKRWYGEEVWWEYQIRTTLFLGQMAVWLAALARGSKPPQHQDMDRIADEKVAERRRAELRYELELLDEEGERRGLDPDQVERAREIREELGLPQPSQPADDDEHVSS